MNASKRKSQKKRLIKQFYAKSGGVYCFYCNTVIKASTSTKDHIVAACSPVSSNRICNLVLSCSLCNHQKSNKPFEEWAKRLRENNISEARIESFRLFANNRVPKSHKGFLLATVEPIV